MELHLIRHPRPAVPAGVCYGQADVGLAEAADAIADRLRPLLPAQYALYASPLARARLLAAELGTPAFDERLKEMHFGDWELVPYAVIGTAIDAWANDPMGFRAPGGESAREMAARVLQWLDGIVANPPAEPVVVVAHGGPLRAITGHLLGLPPERWLGLDFACGHVSRLDIEDWGVVLKWFNR
ncbi:alpha-ribazole phosphatase family protein [Aromatoleum diolicum]|uniref:Phosphoglycerate mutase n=1 Tax=Aromatoleum diolicum TaxID=75796 RepID=A0ABX1QGT8_9RHOO|nr:alpha-ribazole phosphatase family protein [Aromatoleum diolicum]NMG77205.1 phosphoglycerate mutase [Aromatoleum diolicum]